MGLVELLITVALVLLVFIVVMFMVAGLLYAERKIVADMQQRVGPHRVGPYGLFQPFADILKLVFKESIFPAQADKWVYLLAPALSLVPAVMSLGVVPFGSEVHLAGRTIQLRIADFNVAVMYVLAMSSLGVYGIVLSGWSANSKYSLLGGLRSSAQMVSYELAMGLCVVTVVLATGSLRLTDIVGAQQGLPLVLQQPFTALAGVVFLVCAFAETNRAPFDLPEAESELVAGYHTEYSGIKFAMFYMAEYMNMITASAMLTTLFLGGWRGPWLPSWLWFFIKVCVVLFLFIWVRATWPRLRYDRLMALGWKVMLPAGLLAAMGTAALVGLREWTA